MGDAREQLVRDAKEILTSHVGRENPITSQELSDRLGGVDSLDSTPQTRAIIREVMDRYNIPIAGSPSGYFVVSGPAEYERAQRKLSTRIEGIKERKRMLEDAWEDSNRENPQRTLTEAGSDG